MAVSQLAPAAALHPAVLQRIESELEHQLACRAVAWRKYVGATTDEDMDHWRFRVDQWNAAIAGEVAKLYPQHRV
jgi:hypothetical protein